MNTCQKCGKQNTPDTNFCRFCGTRFNLQAQLQPQRQPLQVDPFDHSAPRPYAWKTDEFQTNTEARKTMPTGLDQTVALNPNQNYQPAPLAYSQPQQFAQVFRCPNCMSSYPPRIERKISTAGWITFAALLVFFFPLFWIGLLIKEDVVTCQGCNTRIGG